MESETCWRCSGYGLTYSNVDEDWVAFDKDPKSWNVLLNSRGVDESARADLFALAQYSDDGWKKSLHIIHSLLKKASGGYEVDNASGYVVNNVKNGWHEILGSGGSSSSKAWKSKSWDQPGSSWGSWGSTDHKRKR